MRETKSFRPILIPSATVFFSSACIMTLELVASRLIARHLGSSLYTWTSVIGIVLAGITIGNYLGGRIADRFPARKALAVLLGVSSVTCVATVMLNNLIGNWMLLWYFRWPVRVFTHVFLVFVVPSTLLGTISPVVAKMALDQGLPTGRTVGDIYAWGAAGSIAGTFLTGYYLIAAMGTIAIIWTVAAALLAMAILYWARFWALYIWAALFIALMAMGNAPVKWAEDTGAKLALRKKPDPAVLYEDETQYCYVAVKRISETPDRRHFMQDKLLHSEIIMDDINDLQYFHTIVFASVTRGLARSKQSFAAMHIGGGGYVFPQYIERTWPACRNDVAEIDSGVTKAASTAFGLKPDTTINTITMDARNYVDDLLARQRSGKPIPLYDFIYEDAFSDYSVPHQLVTKEFHDKINQIMTDDGVYMINMIDIYDSGLFLGAYINTLEKTFPHVHVVTEPRPLSSRNAFVIIAAKRRIDFEALMNEKPASAKDLWILSPADMQTLKKKAHEITLTDDFAPVENMLADVVRKSGVDLLAGKYQELARQLKHSGKFEQSITIYHDLITLDPTMSITAYTEIANIRIQQGRLQQAAAAFQKAIEYNEKARTRINMADAHLDLALTLENMGQSARAKIHFRMAVDALKTKLNRNPESHDTLVKLGVALAELGRPDEATDYLQKAVNINPSDSQTQLILAKTLVARKLYDEAIAALNNAINAAPDRQARLELQTYLQLIKTKAKY
ncbi:MAG: fused MFS/spermidine synthase [Planctomycetota bacterium]|nr:MAG: fused MFS/spermidine synthase [Planctomycetota bacterium]